jgi:hypothetical protein
MNILLSILAYVLRAIVPALVQWWSERSTPTAEVSAPSDARDSFRQKVLTSGWGKVAAVTVLCAVIFAAGCSTNNRTIYVPDGEPVKLAADIPNADVWALDKNGTPVRGRLTLHEGWFCAPVPGK